jgi:hypothetical protein
MNLSYPVKHWLASIALGPFILVLYDTFVFQNNTTLSETEFYLMFLFFGFVFSLPLLGLYFLAYRVIIRSRMSILIQRVVLLIGVIVTTLVVLGMIGGNIMNALMTSYSLALITTTWFFDFRKKEIEENLVAPDPILFDMLGKEILISRLNMPLETIKIQSFVFNGKDEIESIYLKFDKWIRVFFDDGMLFIKEQEFGLMAARTEHEGDIIEYKDYTALNTELNLILQKKLIGFEKAGRFKLKLKFENRKDLIFLQNELEPWIFGQCSVEIV